MHGAIAESPPRPRNMNFDRGASKDRNVARGIAIESAGISWRSPDTLRTTILTKAPLRSLRETFIFDGEYLISNREILR
jgi:hypothetical protein